MVGLRVIMLVVLTAASVSAQEVGLTARAEKLDLRLGEPVVVTVEGRFSVELDSVGPIAADSAGMFEVLSIRRDGSEPRWMFELMSIDTGTVFLAPLPFGYVVKGDTTVRTAYANSLVFTVSGVDLAPDADIRDIKPPMNAPWRWGDIWPYLLVVVLAAGGWYVYRKFFTRRHGAEIGPVPIVPAVAPHVRALRELRELEEKKLWQQGKVKEYYSECTEIVRRFFEGRWNFPALEMTSDDILRELSHHADGLFERTLLSVFFGRADMVKFAKGHPTPEEHTQELNMATDIVRAMIPGPPVEEEKEASVAG